MGTYPALGRLTWIVLHAVGMTDGGQHAPGWCDRPSAGRTSSRAGEPRLSARRTANGAVGAGARTARRGAPAHPCHCAPAAVSRAVSSRISDVASAVSRCGTAGPASTERWRSRRELVALLPQVIAGTRRPAAHCYLFHVTPHPYESTRPGQGNPIAPSGHTCIARHRIHLPRKGVDDPSMITLRIQPISGRVGQPAG